MRRTLYSDPRLHIFLDEDTSIVSYVRSREPFASMDQVRHMHENLREVLAALPAGKYALLVDVREAPPRNDEAFEQETTRSITAAMSRFAKSAILVKSAVGRLQVNRLSKTSARAGGELPAFSDEPAARTFLAPR
jgi:hypothetical protein